MAVFATIYIHSDCNASHTDGHKRLVNSTITDHIFKNRSGLIPGDIITHINNEPVASSRDVYRSLEHKGDLVMVVVRNGQRYKVIVSPEE